MSLKATRAITIIITTILALILTRISISYVIVLILIGVITTLITKQKKDALITTALYVITGHISTFPTGMFLDQYIPETPIPIQTTIINNLINQITAILIPLIVGSIITLVTAYITQIIVDKIKPTQKQPQHTYTQQDMKTPKQYRTTQKPKDEIKPEKVEKHIYQDPITKNKRSKDRK